MKKLLAVMAVAGFVACNNASEGSKTSGDTTTVQPAPAQDTTAKQDTSMKMPAADTTAKKDTTKK
ncbi:MAG TPA: hypothetical protein VG870_01360 [Chitinophagaceae bacterium]|nr:hypothetical protein [Chitinophagaceae bacterium]